MSFFVPLSWLAALKTSSRLGVDRRNIGLKEERKRRRRREEKEKKVARAGIEPTAAAPSQPTRLDVSRSDHSAASKETASWRALRQRFGLTRSMGLVRGRKKGKKRERESIQDDPALEKGERQLKSAKIEIISCRQEKYRFERGEKEKKKNKRREREESDKSGDRTYGGSA